MDFKKTRETKNIIQQIQRPGSQEIAPYFFIAASWHPNENININTQEATPTRLIMDTVNRDMRLSNAIIKSMTKNISNPILTNNEIRLECFSIAKELKVSLGLQFIEEIIKSTWVNIINKEIYKRAIDTQPSPLTLGLE